MRLADGEEHLLIYNQRADTELVVKIHADVIDRKGALNSFLEAMDVTRRELVWSQDQEYGDWVLVREVDEGREDIVTDFLSEKAARTALPNYKSHKSGDRYFVREVMKWQG